MKSVFLAIKENYLLLLILVVATILRLYNINYQSVWLDEIHTLIEADPIYNWSEFYNSLLMSDPHPPLYFALVKVLFGFFGHTAAVVRVFSAVIGIVGVYSIYLLGKEIKNKRLGLISAALLAVNYFHIYYSQEARMYAMLFLFTVISFYRLVVLVKKQTIINAIWFGVATGLLVQSHFFAFFVLAAQVFILLYFLFQTEKKARTTFFYQLALSAGIIVVFFIPAIKLFIKTTQIKSFWIQPTTIETIKQIFKDFFFDSSLLLFFTELSIVLLLVFLVRSKSKSSEKKWIFTLLLPWLVLVLLIPVIRSYLSVPMIISRYFITILPPILILTSLGIDLIKKQLILISILALYLGFSIYFLAIEKQYYEVIAKTQFREVTNHVLSNNDSKDEVVSLRGWYLSYFLKNCNTKIVDKTLENHIIEIATNTNNLKSFWYIGAFGDTYSLTAKEEEFINKYYMLADEKTFFDCWTKHYVLKNTTTNHSNVKNQNIQLTNISDQNWYAGVGKFSNMLLLDYTEERLNFMKSCKAVKFKDSTTINVIGFEKTGTYIHVFLNDKAIKFKEVAAYPKTIELIQE